MIHFLGGEIVIMGTSSFPARNGWQDIRCSHLKQIKVEGLFFATRLPETLGGHLCFHRSMMGLLSGLQSLPNYARPHAIALHIPGGSDEEDDEGLALLIRVLSAYELALFCIVDPGQREGFTRSCPETLRALERANRRLYEPVITGGPEAGQLISESTQVFRAQLCAEHAA